MSEQSTLETQPPDDFRNQVATGRSTLDLLLDVQRQHWHQGDRILVEAYLVQQPILNANKEGILDLVYHEILDVTGESTCL